MLCVFHYNYFSPVLIFSLQILRRKGRRKCVQFWTSFFVMSQKLERQCESIREEAYYLLWVECERDLRDCLAPLGAVGTAVSFKHAIACSVSTYKSIITG